ncbi:DNA-3-methyladenine glycosylase [Methanobrevibacter sp. 87.7]|uniref:DNA-3-methyladenine glycosylase I n=1 Tax=Methanobrevibacter sp. 87.7 TaxID=387957 RepID=UPI000B5133B3|nr:DNA-3-methyladenine glycosylase I [Methanobrevibacter sp. 87.7]OWT33735.1 DNA-3-methyladenine glycosylase [Methanobrevibacter sp. 87.7]
MKYSDSKDRCFWCNPDNELYIKYHDEEWGIPNFDEQYLFEMLILESFQAGLSWETILNKRENFKKAFDNFDVNKVSKYDDKKKEELLKNEGIIRHKLKIESAINNAKIFIKIQEEFGSFHNYLKTFTNDKIIYENDKTHSELGDSISKDLKKRGMKFVGPKIIYSYLQAIGVINSHMENCFLYKKQ